MKLFYFFFSLFVSICLASCSSEEDAPVADNNRALIIFDLNVNNASRTLAANQFDSNNYPETIYVTAWYSYQAAPLLYFHNERFIHKGNGKYFSEYPRYWPEKVGTFQCFVSNIDGGTTSPYVQGEVSVPAGHDFLFAFVSSNNVSTWAKPISITLQHPLALVVPKVINKDPNTEIEIDDIQLDLFYSPEKFIWGSGSQRFEPSQKTLSMKDEVNNGVGLCFDQFIPHSLSNVFDCTFPGWYVVGTEYRGTYYIVKVKYNVYDSTTGSLIAGPLEGYNQPAAVFPAGKINNIILSFQRDVIEFNTSIEAYNNVGNTGIEIP